MKSNFTRESVLAGGTVLALLLLINPGHWFMPDMFVMTLVCVAALLFFLFMGFVFAESVHDEREELHRYIAARLGYLGGASEMGDWTRLGPPGRGLPGGGACCRCDPRTPGGITSRAPGGGIGCRAAAGRPPAAAPG